MATDLTITRRGMIMVGGATVIGTSASALAGCASAPSRRTDGNMPDPGGLAAGTELAALSAIPVGGSLDVQIGGTAILLSQPEEGKAIAFSAICRHQGCVVAAAGASLDCPCHGSRYDAATGAVLNGPSTKPLIEIPVEINAESMVVVA